MRIPRIDVVVGTRAGKLTLVAAVVVLLLIDAAITPPTWDDVVLSHRILGSPPFYDAHFDMYLPVFKPLAAIQLPARFFPYPWSYLYVSLTHAVLLAAGAWLTYRVALRYVRRDMAAVAGGLTLLLTAAHYWNTPTRPEAWLLAVLLGVVYLCDTWRLTGRTAYLAAACVLAGALGLSMHTNASIIYIYLALFALWRFQKFTLRDWTVGAGALATSSLVGLGVLLVPQPDALFELLDHYEGRANWDIAIREFERWRWYAVHLRVEPLFPMSVVFGATVITAVAVRRPGLADARSFAERYAGLLIIGLAAFIGLGVLPSAAHPQYAAFYLPTLTVLAVLAYRHRPSSRMRALVCWVATVCATGALVLGLPAYADAGGIGWTTFAVGAYFVVSAGVLCAGWLARRWEMVACAFAMSIMLVFASSAEQYVEHRHEVRQLRRLAEVHEVEVIYANIHAWEFTDSPYNRPLRALYRGAEQIEPGLVFSYGEEGEDAAFDASALEGCAVTELGSLEVYSPLRNRTESADSPMVWLVRCDSG